MELRTKNRSPQEVLGLCRERDVRAVDLRFTDFLGRQHHTTVPVSQLVESAFEEGFGFDGSGIRCWRDAEESDLLLIPQPETAWIDPFSKLSTVALICSVQDSITREEYALDPRNIARRAQNYLVNTGVADVACFGPEAEFFILDQVRFEQTGSSGFFEVDSCEAAWNRGVHGPNLGHKIGFGQGYFPCPPADQTSDLRNEMMQTLIDSGVDVEGHHHAMATAGQAQIDVKYSSLVDIADTVMTLKYIVKNVARRNGRTVTFMPKPIVGDHGSSLHVHFSLWKSGDPLFAGHGYAGLSDVGLHAIGGILKHSPALLALTNPTTNSYKRLAPGFEAPINLAYSQRNRTAACRIPMSSTSPKSKRIEFRCPDPSCNPYLAFAAILMAAIDGIQNKIHPGDAMDQELDDRAPEILNRVRKTPANLEAALIALEGDNDFLLRGDVFTEHTLSSWIAYKREHEILPIDARPHPYEFCLYYDS